MYQLFKVKNQHGFTLVELLTVIVIIGVLVAIAFPVYSSIQETAQTRACQANLRTIDGAIQQWRAADDANTGIPNLAADIMGTYIVDPIVCPKTKTFTYSISGSGVAVCGNGHTYP